MHLPQIYLSSVDKFDDSQDNKTKLYIYKFCQDKFQVVE